MEIPTYISQESRYRYVTYALSVVSGRALPDVRDGLKPVQRRILYAMLRNLSLRPDRPPRKSAAVVGEVLARYHPHGDVACYEAMVRLAQDFSVRYPLIEGQGNFGSLDGDSPAAYRYTEARLRKIALEVLGEINEQTVNFIDNFDATTQEPVVLPSRIPNLLVNGSTGIAVGMATSIPPHNLRDTVRALIALSKDPELSTAKLVSSIKGPDFPTGCDILNSKDELNEIYRSGRGSVKMRGVWKEEAGTRGKKSIVISAIPYAVNKAQLVEKIGTLIADKKVPQFVDVRDESTEEVRVVIDGASGANLEVGMAYLCKNTPLECNFSVNLTVLAPLMEEEVENVSDNDETHQHMIPKLVSLRECLQHFLDFRNLVVKRRLVFEKNNLLKRIHILEGFIAIFDALDEAIAIVRKSEGRTDAAKKLIKRFELTEVQSFAVVDLRVYQLSKTNILELRKELKEKQTRVKEINKTLKDEEAIVDIVRSELQSVANEYGDNRKCSIIGQTETVELKEEDFLLEEEVYAIVTKDGWIKRIKQTNDYTGTRVREGDELFRVFPVSTHDFVAFVTNLGYVYSLRVSEFPSSGGFGAPLQKLCKFRDNERPVEAFSASKEEVATEGVQFPILLVSLKGLASVIKVSDIANLRKSGKRIGKTRDSDEIAVATPFVKGDIVALSTKGYALRCSSKEIPVREQSSLGVALMQIREGECIAGAVSIEGNPGLTVLLEEPSKPKSIKARDISKTKRGLRGTRIVKRSIVSGLLIDTE